MLKAQKFPLTAMEAISEEERQEFRYAAGYECCFIPEGSLTVSPETNTEETDWQQHDSGQVAGSRDRVSPKQSARKPFRLLACRQVQ